MKPKKVKKIRSQKYKPRNRNNFDLCSCGNANCDPAHSWNNPYPAQNKIQKRLSEGKCMGCGKTKELCHCKSRG